MNLQRGMWPEALVAALASMSVGWPLTTLLQEQTWIADGVVMVALVAVLGAVLRSLNTLPSLVAVAQLLAGTWVLCWMYLASTLSFGLPTPRTGTLAVDLLAEAGTVLRQFAAPAPTTTGVAFLVVSVLLLTSVAVDSIGVTNGAPAIAGIPLAAAFLVSVSNNGEPMQPWFFLATAALWLIMVAQQSDRLLAAWPTADLRGFGTRSRFGRGYRNLARVLGGLALTGALITAALLPHLPPTFLGQGLARNAGANNLSGGSQVAFTESMDPGEDLRNESDAPVLEYTSTASSVPPFRVSAASDFDDERWQAPQRDGQQMQGPALPSPVGLSSSAVISSQEVSVTVNTLEAPHLALPVGAVRASVGSPMLQVSDDSGAVLVESPVDSYSATYEEIAADAPADPVGPSAQRVAEQDPRLVRVPEASAPAVRAGAERIVGATTEPLTIGRQLQEHFRSSSYTYSLDLAPEDPDAAEDPISQFLATRQGYCVQFATAMVMMARSQGIPARMAVGFLPGELGDDGARTVVASDAHTWPELYIDGLGWTRFEPTPGVRSGVPPEVTRSDALPTAPQQAPEVPETEPQNDSDTGSEGQESTRWDAFVGWLVRWRWLMTSAVVAVLALAVLPLAGRWYRGREGRRARSERDYMESQWLVLTRSLADLGVPDPGEQSPRAMEAHYEQRARLNQESRAALHRVSARLEQTRYAAGTEPDDAALGTVDTDIETVVESVRAGTSWPVRAKASLLPTSGRAGVAAWVHTRLAGRGSDQSR